MSLLSALTDRLILEATTNPIDPEGRGRRPIALGSQYIEAWTLQSAVGAGSQKIFVLKFPGTGGRAERGGPHPCELFDDVSAEVWTINPLGYGTSDGRASLNSLASGAACAWEEISESAGETPILVAGNSLGCLSAIYVAAKFKAAGLFLRNPLPLVELIKGRYSWWNAGMLSRLIADQIPPELDSVANARECTVPAFFVMSMNDRVVPVKYQQMIIDAYSGPAKIFQVPDADHHHPIPETMEQEYADDIRWLQTQMLMHENVD